MDERLVDLRSSNYREARIKIMQGHFATQNSHINTYIDMSTVKCRQNNASVSAKALAEDYMLSFAVDTIVCLDETEVIGAFLAEELSHSYKTCLSFGNNISVITPEVNSMGQMIFRDNTQKKIWGKQVLLLISSASTGKSIIRAQDCLQYYNGHLVGVASIFSAIEQTADGVAIHSLFSGSDLPHYNTCPASDCPLCKAGQKVDALINSFGYSKL